MGIGLTAIVDILDAIADALDTVMGVAALGEAAVQVVPLLNLAPSQPVSVDMYPADPFRGDTTTGFSDHGELIFTVRARATNNDLDGAQGQLLSLMDDEHALCLAAALEADDTLGGLVAQLRVQGPTGYRTYVDNQGSMLGCEWTVTVINTTS
jgi:hypothetical protein